MQFTGSELTLKRAFYTQSGVYGFAADIVVDNTSGRYQFGLTGAGGSIDFTLNSGRLYYGSQYLSTYRSYEEFSIEGRFTSGSANLIKGGQPLAYNAPKATGYFDYFYFSRANPGMAASFDVRVSGDSTPTFSITQLGYLFASGQEGVTGYFANQSPFPLRVFDSSIQATQNYTFGKLAATIGAPGSGTFTYSGDWDALDLSQPILTTFNTSYQDTTILFTIVDSRTLNKFVYLTGPTDFTFNSTGILNRDVSYLNYSGGVVVGNYNTDLVFRLTYATGQETFTGVWNLFTGINPDSLVSLYSVGTYSTGLISGAGTFAPNSQMTFQVVYSGVSGNAATLLISGQDVLNPITQTLAFNAS